MSNRIAIVMYHYIRDLANSRFPGIKGLDLSYFRSQIQFFKSNFNVISYEHLRECIENKNALPARSLLLSFDDGYIDHYINAFPILTENNISGVFSMPGKIFAEGTLLDVNKIHLVLAAAGEEKTGELLQKVFRLLDYYRGMEFVYPSNEELYSNLATANRFDNKDIMFVKRLLQAGLPERARNLIVNDLFREYIQVPENVVAKELYMSIDQIKLMKRSGMEFALHGYGHYWLEKLSYEEMKNDITKSLDLFQDVIDPNNWVMIYPYGSYNDRVTSYIAGIGCKTGFTTEFRIADLETDSPLLLPRLDTNDFPPKSEKYLEYK